MKRRNFLLTGLGVGGVLVVGWGVLPPRPRLGTVDTLPLVDGEVGLNGWIKIAADGGVLLAMSRSEMGQGVHTALAMLVAEELDVPLVEGAAGPGGPDRIYGNVAMFVSSLPVHPSDARAARTPGARRPVDRREDRARLGITVTGGSSTVVDAWEVLRLAAATARANCSVPPR